MDYKYAILVMNILAKQIHQICPNSFNPPHIPFYPVSSKQSFINHRLFLSYIFPPSTQYLPQLNSMHTPQTHLKSVKSYTPVCIFFLFFKIKIPLINCIYIIYLTVAQAKISIGICGINLTFIVITQIAICNTF